MNYGNNAEEIRISERDMTRLGLETVAYVKPVFEGGQKVFAIHAADGNQITVVESEEIAFVTILQNDLLPLSLH